jgi:hypothetical protein
MYRRSPYRRSPNRRSPSRRYNRHRGYRSNIDFQRGYYSSPYAEHSPLVYDPNMLSPLGGIFPNSLNVPFTPMMQQPLPNCWLRIGIQEAFGPGKRFGVSDEWVQWARNNGYNVILIPKNTAKEVAYVLSTVVCPHWKQTITMEPVEYELIDTSQQSVGWI